MATVYVYVMDTMADWEAAHVMAELGSKRFFRKGAQEIVLRTAAHTREPVRSMGGLTILPDCTVEELRAKPENLLILPGSDRWSESAHAAVLEKAREFLAAGAGVAAICGATAALAGLGLLDDRPHTSNGAGFLDMFCPDYRGAAHYVDSPAVRDGNLITAGSTGGLQMAKLILEYLDVFRADTLAHWYDYFGTGSAQAFFAMLQSAQESQA